MRKSNDRPFGLYLHVPFCRQKCLYCDFCSTAGASAQDTDRYVACLCDELTRVAPQAQGRVADTVYFGGGTPTLLTPAQLSRTLDTLHRAYSITPDAEITVECNPATANEQALRAMRDVGINRLSIGAQSAKDNELASLGRIHTFADTVDTVRAARRAGFDNVSLDIMLGIPHQTVRSLQDTLDALLALDPDHVSAYSLIVEPDTPFYTMAHSLPLPDEDTLCALCTLAQGTLESHGLSRYEISNYARAGRESRHNLHYWCLDDYLGFGPAAHSLWNGVRTGHSRDLSAYLDGQDTTEPEETLTPDAAAQEYVMLRLRLTDGVSKSAYAARFGRDFDEQYATRVAPFVALGLMLDDPDRLRFTAAGFDVSNTVLSEILL